MGFMTEVSILNDRFDEIRKDPADLCKMNNLIITEQEMEIFLRLSGWVKVRCSGLDFFRSYRWMYPASWEFLTLEHAYNYEMSYRNNVPNTQS
jgi:hypothetical protein